MLGHALILSSMIVAATGLLLYSVSLPPEDLNNPVVVVSATPEPVVAPSVIPDATSSGSGAVSVVVVTPSPTPTPVATPTPKPTVDPLTSYNIAATTPQSVLRQAQVHAGRVDPFKSVQPPDLPDFEPAISANQLALPAAFPVIKSDKPATSRPSRTPNIPNIIETQPTPAPAKPLTQGLSLKGIMDGGIDPIAIIEINGRTELFRVGERLPNNIRVTSINYEERRVTLSRGQATGTLYLPEPNSPNF
jgi:hypothetical protein